MEFVIFKWETGEKERSKKGKLQENFYFMLIFEQTDQERTTSKN